MSTDKEEVDKMFDHMNTNPDTTTDEVEQEQEEEIKDEEVELEEEETVETIGEEDIEQEEEETPETDEKDEVINKLRNKVAELETGKAFEPDVSEEEKEKAVEEETKGETQKDKERKVREYVTAEEFDEIQTDPAKLNEVLQRVQQDAYQQALRDIPEVISKTQSRQQTLREKIAKFYENNPELSEYGKYVGYEVNRLRAEDPTKAVSEILEEAGEAVRKELKINKEVVDKEKDRRKNEQYTEEDEQGQGPAFAKRGTGRRTGGKSDTRTEFEKQADKMLASFNG